MFTQFRSKILSIFSSWSFFRKTLLVAFTAILFFENVLLITNNIRQGSPIIGLKLYGQHIAGLSRSRIALLARQKFFQTSRPLELIASGQNFRIKPQDIGAQINVNHLIKQLISLGRNDGFFQNIIQQNKAFFGLSNWRVAQGTVSQTLLSLKILELQDAINRSAKPSLPDFVGDITKTIPPQDGVQIDSVKLSVLIAQNIFHPLSTPLAIPIKTIQAPLYDSKSITNIRNDALQILKEKKPVVIRSGGKTFSLDLPDLKRMLTVVERPDPQNLKLMRLHLRIDDKKLNQKLGQFAAQVEKVTGAEFDDHDARVAIYAQIFGGTRKALEIPTGKKADALNEFAQVFPHGRHGDLLTKAGKLSGNAVQQLAGIGYILAEDTSSQTSPPTNTNNKIVYLTFDDGPNAVYHPLILDILKNYNITATFFLVGNNTIKYSDIAKRTIAEGHKIGNHSLTHAFLPKLPQKEILKEVQQTENILKPINNDRDVILFRPPYGGVNKNVKAIAKNESLKLTLWSVDPRDWSEPTVDDLVNRVVSHTQNGSDILLHSNHLATVKALPKIIDSLQTQGYRFELLP